MAYIYVIGSFLGIIGIDSAVEECLIHASGNYIQKQEKSSESSCYIPNT